MARGVKTDNQTKADIMASYALTNSYNATAKELDVSDKTVKKVIEENKEEFAKVSEEKKELFLEKANRIIDKSLNRLEKEIDTEESIPVNHLTTVIGTLYDKTRLEKGESTENNKLEVNIKVVK